MDFLNSLTACPLPLASSGIFYPPKNNAITPKINRSFGIPKFMVYAPFFNNARKRSNKFL
jgi:hypothetical protein